MSDLLTADDGLRVTTLDSLQDAERMTAQLEPRVLVLVLADPAQQAPAALRAFCVRFERVPVLIISQPAPERTVTELIKAGAGGYLFWEESGYLPDAIRELARGGVPMSLPVSRIVLGRARRSSGQMPAVMPLPPVTIANVGGAVCLTARQQQILELLAGGHSYDHIGVALELSVNTVRSHVKALYERLGASTKVEAVMIGIELRLLNENVSPREPSS